MKKLLAVLLAALIARRAGIRPPRRRAWRVNGR